MDELRYVEFHVTDICNLNCNGCSHFSPMVRNNTCSYGNFKKDILRLAELFGNIKHIRLLGGEPFLEPNLYRYIITARKTFPESDIQIVTNGLLIPNVDEKVLFCIKENDVSLDISLYPPTYEKRFVIKDKLDAVGVKYSVSPMIEKFRKRFCPNEHSDAELSFNTCSIGRRCTFLHNGELALCSAPIVLQHYNEYYKKNYECKDSTINIHRSDVTAEIIIEFLSISHDSCKYCGVMREEQWSRCDNLKKIDMEHWVTNLPIKN